MQPDETSFHKCGKPDCYRKVSLASRYCCHACTTAAEAPAPYEIEPYDPAAHWVLVHSKGCEERYVQRGGAFTAGELWP